MKAWHWVAIVLFVIVVLMVRDPKNTVSEIVSGEQAFTGGLGAVAGGFLKKPGK